MKKRQDRTSLEQKQRQTLGLFVKTATHFLVQNYLNDRHLVNTRSINRDQIMQILLQIRYYLGDQIGRFFTNWATFGWPL